MTPKTYNLTPVNEIDGKGGLTGKGRRPLKSIGTGGTLWVAARFSAPVERIPGLPMFELKGNLVRASHEVKS